MSAYCRFCATKWLYNGVGVRLINRSRGFRRIQVYFTVNVGRKFRDLSWCPLNGGCPLNMKSAKYRFHCMSVLGHRAFYSSNTLYTNFLHQILYLPVYTQKNPAIRSYTLHNHSVQLLVFTSLAGVQTDREILLLRPCLTQVSSPPRRRLLSRKSLPL